MFRNRFFFLTAAIFAVAVSLLTVSPAFAEQPKVEPTEKTPEFVPGSWSIVLLPDTQLYARKYPGLFTIQTYWIAKNADKYNVRYVLHLGDITDGSRKFEWLRAQEAMAELDGKVPYALVPGNHDYHALADRRTRLNDYFPPAKFKKWPTFGGTMNDDLCNSYHLFSAGGTDWLVLALEWAPRDETVDWANRVLAEHSRREAILVTHAYLTPESERFDFAKHKKEQSATPHGYPCNTSANDGEELWQKLVRKNNFALVLCGHVSDGQGFLTSENVRGKKTHQMVIDFQFRELGGEGYLRILEFLPDGKTVQVKTYSPLYDKFRTEPRQQYRFELDK